MTEKTEKPLFKFQDTPDNRLLYKRIRFYIEYDELGEIVARDGVEPDHRIRFGKSLYNLRKLIYFVAFGGPPEGRIIMTSGNPRSMDSRYMKTTQSINDNLKENINNV